jgi:hypothetical protein
LDEEMLAILEAGDLPDTWHPPVSPREDGDIELHGKEGKPRRKVKSIDTGAETPKAKAKKNS